MPQNNDRKESDFSRYGALSTEELSEILRLDSETPEGNGLDIDTLLYITGVLAERTKPTNTGKTAQEAWNSFLQNYLDSEEESQITVSDTKPRKTRNPWIRRIIAAAAVLVLLICIPLTASALSWEDIYTAVIKWAQETFSFVQGNQRDIDAPNAANSRQYTSLQQALEQAGISADLVPTWIPEGYELENIKVGITPMRQSYIAMYVKGEQFYSVCVHVYIESDPQRVEANENIIETYNTGANQYFIISNNESTKVVWTQDSYECYISGHLTIDEIKQMIDSIPKG